jgi:hypothetical protein
MIAESSAAAATSRLSESGVTVYVKKERKKSHQQPRVTTKPKQTKKTNRISINSKDVLIKRGINSNHIPHLVINLQLERGHGRIKVHTVEVVHNQDLTVTLATITWLGALRGLANLDDDHVPNGV